MTHLGLTTPATVLSLAMAFTTAVTAAAGGDGADAPQNGLEADYRQALSHAGQLQQAAESALEEAREQLRAAAQAPAEAGAQKKELEHMQAELTHARRQLQHTARELAHLSRQVAGARASQNDPGEAAHTGGRPLLGVILGLADDTGVKVLGVSPEGPAERAGVEPGDVIVALGGQALAAGGGPGGPQGKLRHALQDIRAGQPLVVSVRRGDQALDLSVVPEVREPLAWRPVRRFPSLPDPRPAPLKIITVRDLEIPKIDTEAIKQKIERIRAEIEARGALLEKNESEVLDYATLALHELSELGDLALQDAAIWAGLPLAHGLKLAEVNPELGRYFKVERGVLVLKADGDNGLKLQAGDVILQVGDRRVDSPAGFMRALRNSAAGEELLIGIRRDHRNLTLKAQMPENRFGLLMKGAGGLHTIAISSTTD